MAIVDGCPLLARYIFSLALQRQMENKTGTYQAQQPHDIKLGITGQRLCALRLFATEFGID